MPDPENSIPTELGISPEYYEQYDLLYQDRTVDLGMWKKLAVEAGGPILELGCGTGRVLHALEETDLPLTGIDISAAALAQAREKISSPDVELCRADMRNFDLPVKDFALILLVHSTFLHNLTMEDQLSCLGNCYRHLRPGGRLAVDVLMPLSIVADDGNGKTFHLGREFADGGDTVQWYMRTTTDCVEQRIECTQYLDRINTDGVVRRSVIRFPIRYVHRFEMDALLRLSGFAVERVHGDYDDSPLRPSSQKMIFVARRLT